MRWWGEIFPSLLDDALSQTPDPGPRTRRQVWELHVCYLNKLPLTERCGTVNCCLPVLGARGPRVRVDAPPSPRTGSWRSSAPRWHFPMSSRAFPPCVFT